MVREDDSLTGSPGMAWWKRLSGALLVAATTMGLNLLSDDLGYRGVFAAAAAAAAIRAALALRRLPVRAPVVRYAFRLLLVFGCLGAMVAVVAPDSWAGPLAFMSALAAALVRMADHARPDRRYSSSATTISLGVVVVGLVRMTEGDLLFGVLSIGVGLAAGFPRADERRWLFGQAVLLGAVSLSALGLVALGREELGGGTRPGELPHPATLMMFILGAAGVLVGIACLFAVDELEELPPISVSAVRLSLQSPGLSGFGAALLMTPMIAVMGELGGYFEVDPLALIRAPWTPVAAMALAVAGMGHATVFESDVTLLGAFLLGGASFVGVGVRGIADSGPLFGFAWIGMGVATTVMLLAMVAGQYAVGSMWARISRLKEELVTVR
ncbi:hypothetical protein [Micromonospora sp. DT62]|uniref:hypothetical protein n=1 Tax=Micromonospora sp. DT62 TaxID=3416521 RepID=UPI003CF5909A